MKTILLLLFLVSSVLCRENELIFIYNAKSGIVNEFLDFAHKISVLVPIIVICVHYHMAIFQ